MSRNAFRDVTIHYSEAEAVDKGDVILLPRVARSAFFMGKPTKVMLVMEWTFKDKSGQRIVWLESIESEASETPTTFSYLKYERAAFQRCFDELSQRTLKRFRESPELQRLSAEMGPAHAEQR